MSIAPGWTWQSLLVVCAVLAAPSILASGSTVAVGCDLAGMALIATGLLLGLRRMASADRASWKWIVFGTLSGVAGSILWELPSLLPTVHGFDVRNLFWLSVYPLTLRGVVLRIADKGRAADVRRALLLDTLVVTGAATVVAWHLLIGPAIGQDASAGLLSTAVTVAYPLGDVAMFALAAALLITPSRRGVREALLVTALGAELPMDLINALLMAHAPDAGDGWYRAGYLMVNGMIAAAVLHPRSSVQPVTGSDPDSAVQGWRVLMLGAGLCAITLSTFFLPEEGWRRIPVAVTAVAALAAILLRFHLASRDLQSAERALHYQATHDQLTGAANRTLLLTELNAAVVDAVPALIFVDLDGFKLVNDSLGHQAGDDVLLAVTRRLAGEVRAEDLVARMGGDEFVIVCHAVDDAAVEALAHRIEESIRRPLTIGGRTVSVGASVGVLLPESGTVGLGERPACTLVAELLEAADSAMYDAKRSGAGVCVIRHVVTA